MSRSRGGTWLTIRSPIFSCPSGDVLEAGDHPQRGRLAAPRRADEHQELAVLDAQVEVVDGPCAVRVDLRHSLERDPRHVRDHKQVGNAARYGAGVHAHGGEKRALAIALALVAGFAGVEAIAGLAADSWRSSPTRRTCSPTRSRSGWRSSPPGSRSGPRHRSGASAGAAAEVLAALANALVLVLLGGWIVWAAIGRLSDPPERDRRLGARRRGRRPPRQPRRGACPPRRRLGPERPGGDAARARRPRLVGRSRRRRARRPARPAGPTPTRSRGS